MLKKLCTTLYVHTLWYISSKKTTTSLCPKPIKKNKKKENTPRRIILFWDNDLQIKKIPVTLHKRKLTKNKIIINMMQNGMEVLNAAAANAGKKKNSAI